MYYSSRLTYRSRRTKQKITGLFLKALIILIALAFVGSIIVFAWFGRNLPEPGKLSQMATNSTIFYDRDGKILFDMYKDKNRVPVKIEDISDKLLKATVAIEDKDFYKHAGISESGVIRVFFNLVFKRRLEGGSTITQQLIKNVLLDSTRTASRKIKEWILAIEVERKYTKNQILEMYLNEIPYGGSYYGIGSAAKGYFNKSPKDLNLLESAILAGLPQSPSVYSPFFGHEGAWRERTRAVLSRMRQDGYITKNQEEKTLKDLTVYKFSSPHLAINAPHFVFYVKDQMEKEFGSKILDQGLKIKTTLNLDIQNKTEKILYNEIKSLKSSKVGNGAVVILDSKTGEILAMAGSYDFDDPNYGKFNAALGLRQPGSAIKPITYSLAFEKGYTPSTVLMDVETVFPDQGDKEYKPVNYDGKFRGPVQLRFALGNSLNIPAVKLLAMVGIRDFLEKANDMGLTTLGPTDTNLKRFGLSLTLGGGEVTLLDLTRAFSIFARGGSFKNEQSISEITDYQGKSYYKNKSSQEKQVIKPEVAFLVSHILSDNNARVEAFGTNSYLNIPGKTVAVKTGTTNDKRDNWAVGYTKSITVGVWVGNNDNSVMDPKIASGLTGASSVWHKLMLQLLNKYGDGIMDKPDKVKAITIDSYLGGLPKDGYPTRSEYFIEGTEPKEVSPFYKKLKISKANGKLANEVEVKSGNYEEKDFIVITESDPVSTDNKNRWQEGINKWESEQKDDKYHSPKETSDASSDNVIVSIKSPGDKENLSNQTVNIKAKIVSLSSIKSVKIYINDNEIKNFNEDKKEIDETTQLADGTYELKIKAVNDKDKAGESSIKFGVNRAWDSSPATPTPSPTPTTN